METKKRHKCIYCGKKRIETRMKVVPKALVDFNLQGWANARAWACYFKTFRQPAIDHYKPYLERRRGHFYQMGDKCQSAIDKAGAVPQINRND